MPTKAERRVELPPGLVPLLSQPQLETYFGVSDWTVLQWMKDGLPVVLIKTGDATPQRKFDLDAVRAWHAERVLAASA